MLISHVFSATEKTTQVPTSTAASTTDGLSASGGKRSSGSWPLGLGATVGVALAGTVLLTVIFGLMVYCEWKRKKGRWFRTLCFPQAPQQGVSQNHLHQNDHRCLLKMQTPVGVGSRLGNLNRSQSPQVASVSDQV